MREQKQYRLQIGSRKSNYEIDDGEKKSVSVLALKNQSIPSVYDVVLMMVMVMMMVMMT